MSVAASSQLLAPFESASELREAHARLLDALDAQLGQDPGAVEEVSAVARLEPEIRQFLERGVATGVYLEEVKERTACQTLLDYWATRVAQAGLQVASARLARFDGEKLPDLKDKPCPYVGLEAFRDRTFFFGRESDTKTLLAQVRDSALVVVLGASGSGKSSLVLGGVLPALAAEGAAPALRIVPPFVPGNAVLESLVDAVRGGGGQGAGSEAEAAEVAALREDSQRLRAMLGGEGAPAVLITIDQFEEVFTLSTPEDREALVANLAQLLAAGGAHRVILTVREEFRNRIVELRALSASLDKAWYSMRPMGYEELRAAVERPAALVNLQFQAGIVDDLIKKVLGQPAALPLLQFTLRALWEKRDRNRITWEVYRKIGDPLTALKSAADQFYDGLAPETQGEVRRVLLELVRVDELLEAYRQPVPKSRLLQAGKANTEEALKLLAENDYVRISAGADAIVEVKHESLVRNWPRFVGWIDEKRIERRRRLALSQAAQRWAESGKPSEGLLTGWQLQEGKGQPGLSALELEFVEASVKEVDRIQHEREDVLRREAEQAKALAKAKKKLLNLTRAALLVVLVAAAAIAWAALYYWERAGELATEDDRLKGLLEKVNADYNYLFAKQVRKTVAPEAISLHISAEAQRSRVDKIALLLRRNGIKVPGIQVKPIPHSEVRYFREEDALGAEEIARLLKGYLAVQVSLPPQQIGISANTDQKRCYEIVFSPNALVKTENAEFSIGVYGFGIPPSRLAEVVKRLEDDSYSVSQPELLQKRPEWLSAQSTVFYYDDLNIQKAQSIAEELSGMTGTKFEIAKGAGLGVEKGEETWTFFVHFVAG